MGPIQEAPLYSLVTDRFVLVDATMREARLVGLNVRRVVAIFGGLMCSGWPALLYVLC